MDLGILVHRALTRIDFTKLIDAKDEVASEAIRAVVEHCLEPAGNSTADLVATAIDIIRQFVRSDHAQELAKAKHVHRELEFMLAWPPKNSLPLAAGQGREGAADSSRFIQGFIDHAFTKMPLPLAFNRLQNQSGFHLQRGISCRAI